MSKNFPDQESLVAALKNGDEQAYNTLVRENINRLLFVAKRYLPNEDDAKEAVQEAFLQAFRAIEKFEGRSNINTWLHRIVVNQCLMRLRSRNHNGEQSIEQLLPRFDDRGMRMEPLWSENKGTEAVVEQSQTKHVVREAIDQLPDNYRSVLLLRDIEEYSTSETAESLNISESAVKTTLHRARSALRTLLSTSFGPELQKKGAK